MKKMLLVVSAVMFLCISCATQTKKEVGSLNFQFSYSEPQMERSGLSIVIVSPQITEKQITSQSDPIPNNPIAQIIAQSNAKSLPSVKNYLQRMRQSFDNSFQEIITKKGFNVMGPISEFDDMTYNDKKAGFLALTPILEIYIDQKTTQSDCAAITNICTETGIMQIGGDFKIDLIEPLTKEKIMSKRINLYDLNIQAPYKKEIKRQSSTVGNIMAIGKELEDTTDKAVTDVLNDFYTKSLEKIVKFISTEEILSYKTQIEGLKNLKRF